MNIHLTEQELQEAIDFLPNSDLHAQHLKTCTFCNKRFKNYEEILKIIRSEQDEFVPDLQLQQMVVGRILHTEYKHKIKKLLLYHIITFAISVFLFVCIVESYSFPFFRFLNSNSGKNVLSIMYTVGFVGCLFIIVYFGDKMYNKNRNYYDFNLPI